MVVAIAFSAGVEWSYHGFFAGISAEPGRVAGHGHDRGGAARRADDLHDGSARAEAPPIKERLHTDSLPPIDEMLRNLAGRAGWDGPATERLRSAGEEALLSLLQPTNQHESDTPPRLVVTARSVGGTVEMEFLAVFVEESLEDHLAYLEEETGAFDDREMSFRLLRHFASSVRHQKYHGMDVVTVRVDRSLG